MSERVVILMAYRGDGEGYGGSGWRDRAFTVVYDHLKDYAPMTIVDSGDQPFNISKSYNMAAKQAGDWDKAIIHPPDVWVPLEQLDHALGEADDGLIMPYDHITKFDVIAGRAFLQGQRNFPSVPYKGAFPPIVIPRWLWDEFNGFDEGLVGHGSEDSILVHCADVFGRKGWSRIPGVMRVLYHPKGRVAPKHEQEFYAHKAENRAVLEEYWTKTTPEELREFLKARGQL